MATKEKNLLTDSKELVQRNEKGQLQPGSILNPAGRPLGTRNFITDFDEAIEEIAEEEGITPSEAKKVLLKKAYSLAKTGNFPFYKDIVDRYYGAPEPEQPKEIHIHNTKINVIITEAREKIIKELMQDKEGDDEL